MLENPLVLKITIFLAATSAVLLIIKLLRDRDERLKERLNDLTDSETAALLRRRRSRGPTLSQWIRTFVPKIGSRLLPESVDERSRLQLRLLHAGIYSTTALPIFVALRFVLMIAPLVLGLLAGVLGIVETQFGLVVGAVVGGFGMLLPNFWLDWKKSKRQSVLRRSLPDFLDLIVACLESGLSLEGAIQRVSDELSTAHPVLAGEMKVVQKEANLGRTIDEALMNFAERSDLEVIRTLSSFVQQARRFGASMGESLRVHADMLRAQREQRAEEMAQKAAVKILFPTLLFIFPAIFVVLVGPAGIQLHEKFVNPEKQTAEAQ